LSPPTLGRSIILNDLKKKKKEEEEEKSKGRGKLTIY